MINALVSHEMRNPLNSVNAMILKIKMLQNKLLTGIESNSISTNDLESEVLQFLGELSRSCDTL